LFDGSTATRLTQNAGRAGSSTRVHVDPPFVLVHTRLSSVPTNSAEVPAEMVVIVP